MALALAPATVEEAEADQTLFFFRSHHLMNSKRDRAVFG